MIYLNKDNFNDELPKFLTNRENVALMRYLKYFVKEVDAFEILQTLEKSMPRDLPSWIKELRHAVSIEWVDCPITKVEKVAGLIAEILGSTGTITTVSFIKINAKRSHGLTAPIFKLGVDGLDVGYYSLIGRSEDTGDFQVVSFEILTERG